MTLPPGGLGAVLHGVACQLHVGLLQRGPVRRYLGERHLPLAEQCRDPLGRQPRDGKDTAAGIGHRCPLIRQHGRRVPAGAGPHRDPVPGCGREQVRDGRVGDDRAAADDHQVPGGLLQFAHQVAGHQDRAAPGGQRGQEAAHPHDALGVHAVERLVQQQHRRVTQQRGGDPEPLPHAQGVAARLPPCRCLQARLLDDLIDPAGAQALGMSQPQQVVAGGPARLQRRCVEQRPHLGQRPPQVPVRPPADQRGALVGGVQAEDHPHRGGFPSPVRADEAGSLARPRGERHPV